MPSENDVLVTQADRDAADAHFARWCPDTVWGYYALVQAFARHRAAGMEQAAVMLDTVAKDEQARAEANKGTQLGSCAAYTALAFRQEAIAIRQAIGAAARDELVAEAQRDGFYDGADNGR